RLDMLLSLRGAPRLTGWTWGARAPESRVPQGRVRVIGELPGPSADGVRPCPDPAVTPGRGPLPCLAVDDSDRWWRAFQSRDARFDGRVFMGVTSTGIYCRPVCPAPSPRRDRVRFFPSAAAAAAAGFRACRRCRPETA